VAARYSPEKKNEKQNAISFQRNTTKKKNLYPVATSYNSEEKKTHTKKKQQKFAISFPRVITQKKQQQKTKFGTNVSRGHEL
jgi:hypothetical protein